MKSKEKRLDGMINLQHKLQMYEKYKMVEVSEFAKDIWKTQDGRVIKVEDLPEEHIINIVNKFGVEGLFAKNYDKVVARYLEITKGRQKIGDIKI